MMRPISGGSAPAPLESRCPSGSRVSPAIMAEWLPALPLDCSPSPACGEDRAPVPGNIRGLAAGGRCFQYMTACRTGQDYPGTVRRLIRGYMMTPVCGGFGAPCSAPAPRGPYTAREPAPYRSTGPARFGRAPLRKLRTSGRRFGVCSTRLLHVHTQPLP